MPRSSYIYSVFDWNPVDDTLDLVYAATVKHELVSWLKRHPAPLTLEVFRIPDGVNNRGNHKGTYVNVLELIREDIK